MLLYVLPPLVYHWFAQQCVFLLDWSFSNLSRLRSLQLATDLKQSSESWEASFADFVSTASTETRKIIAGIQYYHECHASAIWHSMSTDKANALEAIEMPMEDVADDERHAEGAPATGMEELLMELIMSKLMT